MDTATRDIIVLVLVFTTLTFLCTSFGYERALAKRERALRDQDKVLANVASARVVAVRLCEELAADYRALALEHEKCSVPFSVVDSVAGANAQIREGLDEWRSPSANELELQRPLPIGLIDHTN